MKALLLAAGEGTRLRPLTATRPKPMLPIGGRPILEHQIGYLRDYAITDIAINLHYMPQTVVDHFGDGRDFGVSITYSYERQLLGSAGAAKALEWFFDEPFVVLYADVLTDVDLATLTARHHASGAFATLALHEVPDPWRCGVVQTDAEGWITRFIEKPARGTDCGNLANSGIYIVEPHILRWIPPGRPFDFGSDLFPLLIEEGLRLLGDDTPAYTLDIGSPQRYSQAEADVQEGRYRSTLLTQVMM